MLGSGSIIVADDTTSIVELALRTAQLLPPRVVRQVHAVPRGHQLDGEDARAGVRGEATPMDLDIIASVQKNIIGNCLCVLGDSMAMPVGSMVEKFRDEFDDALENGVPSDSGNGHAAAAPTTSASPPATRPTTCRRRGADEPADPQRGHPRRRRPSRSRRPRATMLVDAAKHGDVEIPVFCYEPKLGEPVGACRMCLVEIEGIPKLQTACSTPVRDGMVVYTQTDRVKEAQNAVVEFLLVNHPLDCPVCDKGGECPLQDISMGWGPGKSRVTDPKRHFQKPLAALAAGRDRPRALHPLLPLRALQPGGRRGRAAAAARARRPQLRRHLRRPPLRRALPRQHHRALPRRRPDLLDLPLPRPALGHRGRGLGLHALPEPVQRQVHGPRRAGRCACSPATTTTVDDGWLCDKGRFGFQMFNSEDRITEPMVRAGRRRCSPVDLGRRDLETAAEGLERGAAPRPPRSSAAAPPTRRATSPSGSSARRSARPTSTSLADRSPTRALLAELSRPELSGRMADLDYAGRDPRGRRRPDARDADPRPADPQGGAPQRRQARRRHRAPDRARRRRRRGGSATRPAAAPASSPALRRRLAGDAVDGERADDGEVGSPRR